MSSYEDRALYLLSNPCPHCADLMANECRLCIAAALRSVERETVERCIRTVQAPHLTWGIGDTPQRAMVRRLRALLPDDKETKTQRALLMEK